MDHDPPYNFGARYYDPRTSGWQSPDPILASYLRGAPNGGIYKPSQLNLFGYVSQRPLNVIDPDGRAEFMCAQGSACAQGLGAGDWLTSDRISNSDRWQNANARNLGQSGGPAEYSWISQRADFYRWYQGTENARGGETRWAGAAAGVADDVALGAGSINSDIRNFMEEGNRAIFNDVFSKLGAARSGTPLKGEAAQNWDMMTLSEEQNLTQPLYAEAAAGGYFGGWGWGIEGRARQTGIFGVGAAIIFGEGPPFKGSSLASPSDRWLYGMGQMGYGSGSSMPVPGPSYLNGSALRGSR